jgi:hypothetical protein
MGGAFPRWSTLVRGALLAAAAAVAFALGSPASGRPTVIPPGNLLQNPGAEAGPGSSGSGRPVQIPNWTTQTIAGDDPSIDGFTVVAYGSSQFPDKTITAKIGGGTNFFTGGNATRLSTAAQTVDVSIAATEIDAGQVGATLSADIGGYAGQEDSGIVGATFSDASGVTISGTQIGPVTAADRKGVTTLLARSATTTVPVGTRSITVTMIATRQDGSWNDAYFDNIGLQLGSSLPTVTGPPPAPTGPISPPLRPPVGGQTVDVQTVSGSVLINGQPLTGGQQIPVNATVDATRGVVTMTSASPKGGLQTANFSGGIFKVAQRGQKGSTQLTLSGGRFAICKAKAKRKIATKPKPPPAKKTILRSLWGNGTGTFLTNGRYASATVRGTIWLTQDRCDGTRIVVQRGIVAVFDRRLHKTILVKAGKTYLAKA